MLKKEKDVIFLKIDFTLTITVIIALAAIISPVLVALINNRHNAKMREKEMLHEQRLKQLELSHELAVKQLDMYYIQKKTAFENFLVVAGKLLYDIGIADGIPKLHSAAANALLYCSEENKIRISAFLRYSYTEAGSQCELSENERLKFSERITELSYHLNEELKSTACNI